MMLALLCKRTFVACAVVYGYVLHWRCCVGGRVRVGFTGNADDTAAETCARQVGEGSPSMAAKSSRNEAGAWPKPSRCVAEVKQVRAIAHHWPLSFLMH